MKYSKSTRRVKTYQRYLLAFGMTCAMMLIFSVVQYTLMHNSLKAYSLKADRKGCDTYNDIYANIRTEIEKFINIALKAGINSDKIMLDPGIGFAKDYDMNMDMIANAEFIKQFGYPILLGVSNKSVIGNTLNLPVEDRLEGTLAATAYAVMQGYSYVRVHDVKSNVRVINMLEKLMEYR